MRVQPWCVVPARETVRCEASALHPSKFRTALTLCFFAVAVGWTNASSTLETQQQPSISIRDAAVGEGNAGVQEAAFSVVLSSPSAVAVTVDYTTVAVSAETGSDFVQTSGTLTFGPNDTVETVVVPVLGESGAELTETFTVVLSNASNATILDGVALGEIVDDDEPAADVTAFPIYEESFSTGSADFYSYAVKDGTRNCIENEGPPATDWSRPGCRVWVDWRNGYIESVGPWWVDPNHMYEEGAQYPGLGFLHVISFVYAGGRHLDLSEGRVRFDMMLHDADLKGAQLRFWIQGPCIGSAAQACNFEFVDHILNEDINSRLVPNEWRRITFNLPVRQDAWRCLGGYKDSYYGCLPAADALKTVENFGFVLIPVQPDPVGDISASGRIRIDNLRLFRYPTEQIEWTREVETLAINSDLKKTSNAATWTAGASSRQSITEGDGFVEFSANGSTASRMIGLANSDGTSTGNTMDFALHLSAQGRVEIFESGLRVRDTGSYNDGDRFRIGIENGVVQYRRNGSLLGTSGTPPQYPLRADAAILTANGRIDDGVIAGALADDPTWSLAGAATLSGNTISKTGGSDWDASAVSAQYIRGGAGFVDFGAATEAAAGLSTANASTGIQDIDFAIVLHANGTIEVSESGVSRGTFGTWSRRDRFRVIVDEGVVRYCRNGSEFLRSSKPATYPLRIDSSLGERYAAIDNAVIFGASETINWTSVVGVTPTPTGLSKASLAGWNAGAVSTSSLLEGDGHAEFVVDGPPAYRIVGLSVGDTSQSYDDIDFGILLTAESDIVVYEGGQLRGVFGSYSTGDRLRVGIEGGQVRYWHNGEPIYTSGLAPRYPLLVDTSFYDVGSSIKDVVLTGSVGASLWGTSVGAVVGIDSLVKVGGSGWDAFAVSSRTLGSTPGFLEFTASETNTSRLAGLTTRADVSNISDIEFGFLLSDSGQALIYESGAQILNAGSYITGDRFRVAVESGNVTYWLNGRRLRTGTATAPASLSVAAALFSEGATLTEVALVSLVDTYPAITQPTESVAWTATVEVSASGSSLSATSGDWAAGAVSTRGVISGDATLDFDATGPLANRIVGLSAGNSGTGYEDVSFGILLTAAGEVTIYEEGVFKGFVAYYSPGDRFRVSVSSGLVQYWRNGARIYATIRQPEYPLLVDTSFFNGGGSISNVTLAGTIGDAFWAASSGVRVTGTTLQKVGSAGWNAGAISTRTIRNAGLVNFTASETTTDRIIGLSHGNTNQDFTDVDFGILLTSAGQALIYERGVQIAATGAYASGDVFRVTAFGSSVTYWRNGRRIHTSSLVPTYPLLVDSALFSPNATLTDVRLVDVRDVVTMPSSVAEAVSWTTVVNASAGTSGALSRTNGEGWNAGAVSTTAITEGDGYVEFTAAGSRGYGVFGLSHGDSSQSYEDVDFGILLAADGFVAIYEAGEYLGVVGQYQIGDRFRVVLTSGVVSYWQNDTHVFTSVKPPIYPLVLDAAIFSSALRISSAGIAGTVRTSAWSLDAGLTFTNGKIEKTGPEGWNSGAVSLRQVTNVGGFVEFTAEETNTVRVVALSNQSEPASYDQVDYGVLLNASAQMAIYESGLVKAVGAYTAGNRFRISVSNGRVRYWRDGTLLYTSVNEAIGSVRAHVALYSTGATVGDLVIRDVGESAVWDDSNAQAVSWQNPVGVQATGSTITRTTGIGWNAGATSGQQIAGTRGYMEFTAYETNSYRIAGFGSGNTDEDYTDVEFGVLLTDGGHIVVYEAGEFIGVSLQRYQVGDRFRVSVDDGLVRYWHNGTLFYTSVRQPARPLLVDTSLFSSGATVTDVVISGATP